MWTSQCTTPSCYLSVWLHINANGNHLIIGDVIDYDIFVKRTNTAVIPLEKRAVLHGTIVITIVITLYDVFYNFHIEICILIHASN